MWAARPSSSPPVPILPRFVQVRDAELSELLGEAKFFSITYRLFKVPGRLETLCEDYGQAAKYKVRLTGTRSFAWKACVYLHWVAGLQGGHETWVQQKRKA